jgi:UPF0176 protein
MNRHFQKIFPMNLENIANDSPATTNIITDSNTTNSDTINFYSRRQPKNHSDSLNPTCSCRSGTVLLFYCYQPTNPTSLAKFMLEICKELDIFGKIRISVEGFNCTLGGTQPAISLFITRFLGYLNRQNLDDEDFISKFFKPSRGCKHVFDSLSIKIVDKLFSIGNVQSKSTSTIDEYLSPSENILSPQEFHDAIGKNDTVLLDIRNYYETRIGKFENALTLPIRYPKP